MRRHFTSVIALAALVTACSSAGAGSPPSVPAPAPVSSSAPLLQTEPAPSVNEPQLERSEPDEPRAQEPQPQQESKRPARTPGGARKSGCAGPADPRLTRDRVAGMLQGDDSYPHAQIVALAPGVVPALVELAGGLSGLARYRAITLLGDIACRDTAPFVESLLRDRDPLVRLYATTALGTILGADATEPPGNKARSRVWAVRSGARGAP